MSTKWAKDTEDMVCQNDPMHIICPLILYTDGVAVGFNNQKSLQPIVDTIGNFSDKLMNKDEAKFTIGFIETLNFSKTNILKHLRTKCGYSKTFAEEAFKHFTLQIHKAYFD